MKPPHPPAPPAPARRLRLLLFAALTCLLDLAVMDVVALQHKPQPPAWLSVITLSLTAIAFLVTLHASRYHRAALRRPFSVESLTAATIHLASVIAAARGNPQRAKFAQQWAHFLDVDDEPQLKIYSNRERLQSAFKAIGFAFKLRTRPVRDFACRPADWILITNKRTYSFIVLVDASMIFYLLSESQFADVLMHAPHTLLIVSGSLYALARYLRKIRGVALMTHRRKHRD